MLKLTLSGAVLAASFFFGASRATVIFPQLLALWLLVLTAEAALPRVKRSPLLLALVAGLVLLPLIQLAPLPPALWGALPGRADVLSAYAAAGVEAPWAPIALQPANAWRAWLMILPGLALFSAALTMGADSRRVMIGLLLGLGVLSVCVALLQALGVLTDSSASGGRVAALFVNRNHFASFLAVMIPFAAVLIADRRAVAGAPVWMIGAGCLFVFILGQALTGSRSVLVLAGLALAVSWVWLLRRQLGDAARGRTLWIAVGLGAAVLLPLLLAMGLTGILDRFTDSDVVEDARWTIFSGAWRAALAYFPFGSGLGSFQQVYQIHEATGGMTPEFINNAHNDWLELFLEFGFAGAALMAVWIVWLARRSARWLRASDGLDERIAKAAIVGLWLLSLHSLWDYPLRAVALSATFGLLCALTQRAPAERLDWLHTKERHHRGRSHSRKRRRASAHPQGV